MDGCRELRQKQVHFSLQAGSFEYPEPVLREAKESTPPEHAVMRQKAHLEETRLRMNNHAASGGESNLSPVGGDRSKLSKVRERRLFPVITKSGLMTAQVESGFPDFSG
jgi:hypothetical protein